MLVVVYSCNKVGLVNPSFDVTTSKNTYKVGDTVIFNFSGNPDFIVYYSGEAGFKYQNRNRLTDSGGITQLQFVSSVSQGNQTGNLALLISNNFNGSLDSNSIHSANWIDITKKATLSTGTASTPSGIVDLSSFQTSGNPYYIAFKYQTNFANGTKARQWIIGNFQVTNFFPDSCVGNVADDINTAGFQATSVRGDSLKWSVAATTLKFLPGFPNNIDEDWVISKPMDFNQVSPDQGVAIKNTSFQLNDFRYLFSKAGSYDITFVATNVNGSNQSSVIKQMKLTITP